MERAEKAIDAEIEKIKSQKVSKRELEKSKQQIESGIVFSEINIANRALNLAYFEMLGDASDINSQVDFYNTVSDEEVQQAANDILREENCSVMYYLAEK
jgi:predicted Zn-dependent peptidase